MNSTSKPAGTPRRPLAEASADPLQAYVEAIPEPYRPLFERIQQLITSTCPDVNVGLSYQMPAYKVGNRRLYVGVWRHGISIYGWKAGHDGGFLQRHPDLLSSKGTVQLRPQDAAAITDDELFDLIRSALEE